MSKAFTFRTSISQKLFLVLCLTVTLFALQFVSIYLFSQRFLKGFLNAYENSQRLKDLNQIQYEIAANVRLAKSLALPEADVFSIKKTYEANVARLEVRLKGVSASLAKNRSVENEVSDFIAHWFQLDKTVKDIFTDWATTPSASPKSLSPRISMIEQFRIETAESADRVVIILRSQLNELFRDLYATRNRPLIVGFLFMASSSLLLFVLSWFLIRNIKESIRNLERLSQEVGSGNLQAQAAILHDDEIGKLTDSFNQMISRLRNITVSKDILERKNQELEHFAYVASHDLQEPLRMVGSYVELLRQRYRGKLDADADDFIEFAVDGSRRMKQLINDLLEYSRVGTKKKEFQRIEAADLLKDALKNLEVVIHESGARITHDPLPSLRGDPIQLLSLFQNLIGNAIKFRGDKPPVIHIGVLAEDTHWVFSFKDQGIGIEPDFYERIFVIFQRLHGQGEYPGTGIGLALCRKIVERHGGKIWVESRMGAGSTFFFTIPKTIFETKETQ